MCQAEVLREWTLFSAGGGSGIPKIARTQNVPPSFIIIPRHVFAPLQTCALKSCPPLSEHTDMCVLRHMTIHQLQSCQGLKSQMSETFFIMGPMGIAAAYLGITQVLLNERYLLPMLLGMTIVFLVTIQAILLILFAGALIQEGGLGGSPPEKI